MHHTILAVLAVNAAAYWILLALGSLRAARSVPLLERLTPREPSRWPRVSVVVPACNEVDTLGDAMRSRLGESYPDAEYIVVDDRSTDGTGAIVDQLAREDARVVPLHIADLPDGWLGKVHAMQVAFGHATGEWVLFSDADVHHEPGTLRRIVAYCEENAIDHVCVFPSVWSSTFWLDAVMSPVLRLLTIGTRPWKITDPSSRVSFGGGNFNLVRRSALERIGGLERLKLELIDDAGLGQLLKWSGAKAAVLNARGFVGLYFYRSVREAVLGLEKNAFASMGRLSVLRFTAIMVAILASELGALAAFAGGDGWVRILAGATLVVALGVQIANSRWLGRPILPGLFAPFGILVMVAASFRSMFLTLVNDGVAWRGTRYSLETLRRGMTYEQA